MNDSTTPYEPPSAATIKESFLRCVLIPSGVVSSCAIVVALLLDRNRESLGVPWVICASPGVVAAFAVYSWTAFRTPLASGSNRNISAASTIAIGGIVASGVCFVVGNEAITFIQGLLKSEWLFSHSLANILYRSCTFSCAYSLVYAFVHRIVFRRSQMCVFLKILIPVMGLFYILIFWLKVWIKSDSEYFGTLSTTGICYIAYANCLAWWLSESRTTSK